MRGGGRWSARAEAQGEKGDEERDQEAGDGTAARVHGVTFPERVRMRARPAAGRGISAPIALVRPSLSPDRRSPVRPSRLSPGRSGVWGGSSRPAPGRDDPGDSHDRPHVPHEPSSPTTDSPSTFRPGPSSPGTVLRRLGLVAAALVAGTALLPPAVASATPLPSGFGSDFGDVSVRVLGGAATIVPGRSGLVEISGVQGCRPAGRVLAAADGARRGPGHGYAARRRRGVPGFGGHRRGERDVHLCP